MAKSHFKADRAFLDFSEAIWKQRRFVPNADMLAFIDGVRATAKVREFSLKQGQRLFRAQIGYDWYTAETENGEEIDVGPLALPESKMVPDPEKVGNNRANPRGIAYLYTAGDRATAIAEVRPLIHEHVSVGVFEVLRDLTLVNCAWGHNEIHFFGLDELGFPASPEDKWDGIVWASIDRAFARPIGRADSERSYLPTQYIAEVLRAARYDGIVYKSSLGAGLNLALFDPSQAELVSCELLYVDKVVYDTSETGSGYARPSPSNKSKKSKSPTSKKTGKRAKRSNRSK